MSSSPDPKRTVDDRLDEWLAGMSDEAKADILKARFHEEEETNRQRSTDDKVKQTDSGYQSIRAVALCAGAIVLFAGVISTSCSYQNKVQLEHDVQVHRIHAEHPEAFPTCTACPACVAVPAKQ